MAYLRDFYNKREVEGSSVFLRREVLKILKEYKEYNVEGEKYLDIGIGNGTFTEEIAAVVKSREVCGIDISEKAIELAKAKNIKAVKVDINNEKLPYSDGYFDLVTAVEVVEHLINTDNLFSEAYRVVKPGGYFLVTSPNMASWLSILSLILG